MTWNVAAVNNNPFEYWISHPDPASAELSIQCSGFSDTANGLARLTSFEKVTWYDFFQYEHALLNEKYRTVVDFLCDILVIKVTNIFCIV